MGNFKLNGRRGRRWERCRLADGSEAGATWSGRWRTSSLRTVVRRVQPADGNGADRTNIRVSGRGTEAGRVQSEDKDERGAWGACRRRRVRRVETETDE